MAHDKNISPVGWYLGSYLLRFVELEDVNKNDDEKRFTSWVNTVLVTAKSLESAYDKVQKIGKTNSKPYRGGSDAVRVRWEYLGIVELLPLYEKLADGAEIAWANRSPRKLITLKRSVKSKKEIFQ